MDSASKLVGSASENATQERQYRCPGHEHTIDRGLHLSRLAAFYPACLHCEDRHDTDGLTTIQRQELSEIARQARSGWRWTGEGLDGSTRGQIDPALPRSAATALAVELWENCPGPWQTSAATPTILVGGDGTAASTELLPVLSQALQLAGCLAVDVGSTTTACLAAAVETEPAQAALWVGNATSERHALSLRFFLERGLPASSGTLPVAGNLDSIRERAERKLVRPKRGGGALARREISGEYLSTLASVFHGLRPLTIVLDTSCEPLVCFWNRLAEPSACRIIRPSWPLTTSDPDRTQAAAETRLAMVAREVVVEGAHFGLWIDGSGERIQLVDERGQAVTSSSTLLLLANFLRRRGGHQVNLPGDSPAAASDLSRQQVARRVASGESVLAGDGQGRVWLAGGSAAPDALAVWCLLLALLSESDLPLSEVLEGVSKTT